jgi:hypothetical protein
MLLKREIILARPSYTRKFKEIQDFKVKNLSDSSLKKSNSSVAASSNKYEGRHHF